MTDDASGSGFAGNAVDLDWAAPIQIAGNAVGALGNLTNSVANAKVGLPITQDMKDQAKPVQGALPR